MNRIIKNVAILALIPLGFSSCKDSKVEDEDAKVEMQMRGEEANDANNDIAQKGAENEVRFNEEKTAEIFKYYKEVKDALVAAETETAAKQAQKLSEKSQGEVLAAANKIASASDINLQREAFSELTSAMEPILDGALTSGEIYKQYCPMAFEGKGDYWYSNSKEIRNPYYGASMLKCGEVKQEIK